MVVHVGRDRPRRVRAQPASDGRRRQRATARAALEPARLREQHGAARTGGGSGRLDELRELLEAPADVLFGVEEVRADPKAVAAVVRADVALEQRVADLLGL